MFKQIFIVLFLIIELNIVLSKPIEILIIGNAGIGKSTLINNLMNEEVAKVNDYDTGTYDINVYDTIQYGFEFKIYDTPGFNDVGNDDNSILNMIIIRGPKLNIILLCYDISLPRIYKSDKLFKNNIVDAFGKDILNYVLVVYTKSNMVDGNKLNDLVDKRHKQLELEGLTKVLAYNNNHGNWKSNIWFKMLDISKKNNFNVFDIFNRGTFVIQEKMRIKNNKKTEYEKKINDILIKQNTNNECFDINSDIYVKKNNIIHKDKLKNIKNGDYVKTNNGFSQVYFTYEHDEYETLINIATLNDIIKLTSNHIIMINRNDEEIYILAKEVIKGDLVKTLYLDKFYWSEVLNINYSYDKTKYILTYEDTIVINDILASCHVDDHNMGYYLTYLLRFIYKYCPSYLNQDNLIIEILKFIYTFFMHN